MLKELARTLTGPTADNLVGDPDAHRFHAELQQVIAGRVTKAPWHFLPAPHPAYPYERAMRLAVWSSPLRRSAR